MQSNSRPLFSIIIPALNEEKYIGYALEGIKHQTLKDYEIIVVDGGSKDRTREIAKKYAHVIVDTQKPGAARARNVGAENAKGKYLLFIDADTKPSPKLLETYLRIFENNKSVVAATGPVFPLEKTSKKIRLGYKFVSVYFVRLMLLLRKPSINGMNFAARKDAFKSSGGFNEDFITYEDWDLSRRLSKLGRIAFDKKAVVYSSARRVKAWGLLAFAKYHIGNMLRYALFKRPKSRYEEIR
ncbi:MAG: glycosyltransferase [Candidatus Micrarchaeia archaeon]